MLRSLLLASKSAASASRSAASASRSAVSASRALTPLSEDLDDTLTSGSWAQSVSVTSPYQSSFADRYRDSKLNSPISYCFEEAPVNTPFSDVYSLCTQIELVELSVDIAGLSQAQELRQTHRMNAVIHSFYDQIFLEYEIDLLKVMIQAIEKAIAHATVSEAELEANCESGIVLAQQNHMERLSEAFSYRKGYKYKDEEKTFELTDELREKLAKEHREKIGLITASQLSRLSVQVSERASLKVLFENEIKEKEARVYQLTDQRSNEGLALDSDRLAEARMHGVRALIRSLTKEFSDPKQRKKASKLKQGLVRLINEKIKWSRCSAEEQRFLLKAIIDSRISFTVLEIEGCEQLTSKYLLPIIKNSPNLQKLVLKACGLGALKGTFETALDVPTLQQLTIEDCRRLSRIHLFSPLLDGLSIKNCPKMVSMIVGSKGLRDLYLQGLPEFTSAAYKILVSGCSFLQPRVSDCSLLESRLVLTSFKEEVFEAPYTVSPPRTVELALQAKQKMLEEFYESACVRAAKRGDVSTLDVLLDKRGIERDTKKLIGELRIRIEELAAKRRALMAQHGILSEKTKKTGFAIEKPYRLGLTVPNKDSWYNGFGMRKSEICKWLKSEIAKIKVIIYPLVKAQLNVKDSAFVNYLLANHKMSLPKKPKEEKSENFDPRRFLESMISGNLDQYAIDTEIQKACIDYNLMERGYFKGQNVSPVIFYAIGYLQKKAVYLWMKNGFGMPEAYQVDILGVTEQKKLEKIVKEPSFYIPRDCSGGRIDLLFSLESNEFECVTLYDLKGDLLKLAGDRNFIETPCFEDVYSAFDLTDKKAYHELCKAESLEKIKPFLLPFLHSFKEQESFLLYLKTQKIVGLLCSAAELDGKIRENVEFQEKCIESMIHYLMMSKLFSDGKLNVVLLALARLQNKAIYLWRRNDKEFEPVAYYPAVPSENKQSSDICFVLDEEDELRLFSMNPLRLALEKEKMKFFLKLIELNVDPDSFIKRSYALLFDDVRVEFEGDEVCSEWLSYIQHQAKKLEQEELMLRQMRSRLLFSTEVFTHRGDMLLRFVRFLKEDKKDQKSDSKNLDSAIDKFISMWMCETPFEWAISDYPVSETLKQAWMDDLDSVLKETNNEKRAQLEKAFNLKYRQEFYEEKNAVLPEKVLPCMPVSVGGPIAIDFSGSNEEVVLSKVCYVRRAIAGDGDCGYTAFGLTRKQAYDLLKKNIEDSAVRGLLLDSVKELLLTTAFSAYLREQGIVESLIKEDHLEFDLMDPRIFSAFLDFDVRDKKHEGGWAHPAILRALACIQGLELRIWCVGDDKRLLPHKMDGYYDYHAYIPSEGVPTPQRQDLLFINGNHFERLEFVGLDDAPTFEAELIYPASGEQKEKVFAKQGNASLMHLALRERRVSVVWYLLGLGYDPRRVEAGELSAIEVAKQYGLSEVVAVMEEWVKRKSLLASGEEEIDSPKACLLQVGWLEFLDRLRSRGLMEHLYESAITSAIEEDKGLSVLEAFIHPEWSWVDRIENQAQQASIDQGGPKRLLKSPMSPFGEKDQRDKRGDVVSSQESDYLMTAYSHALLVLRKKALRTGLPLPYSYKAIFLARDVSTLSEMGYHVGPSAFSPADKKTFSSREEEEWWDKEVNSELIIKRILAFFSLYSEVGAKVLPNSRTPSGESWLMLAFRHGSLSAVFKLVGLGADLLVFGSEAGDDPVVTRAVSCFPQNFGLLSFIKNLFRIYHNKEKLSRKQIIDQVQAVVAMQGTSEVRMSPFFLEVKSIFFDMRRRWIVLYESQYRKAINANESSLVVTEDNGVYVRRVMRNVDIDEFARKAIIELYEEMKNIYRLGHDEKLVEYVTEFVSKPFLVQPAYRDLKLRLETALKKLGNQPSQRVVGGDDYRQLLYLCEDSERDLRAKYAAQELGSRSEVIRLKKELDEKTRSEANLKTTLEQERNQSRQVDSNLLVQREELKRQREELERQREESRRALAEQEERQREESRRALAEQATSAWLDHVEQGVVERLLDGSREVFGEGVSEVGIKEFYGDFLLGLKPIATGCGFNHRRFGIKNFLGWLGEQLDRARGGFEGSSREEFAEGVALFESLKGLQLKLEGSVEERSEGVEVSQARASVSGLFGAQVKRSGGEERKSALSVLASGSGR